MKGANKKKEGTLIIFRDLFTFKNVIIGQVLKRQQGRMGQKRYLTLGWVFGWDNGRRSTERRTCDGEKKSCLLCLSH